MSALVDSGPRRLHTSELGGLTVNINPQFIEAINSVVAQEINGDVHLKEEDSAFWNSSRNTELNAELN
jgi:hypothetical protein